MSSALHKTSGVGHSLQKVQARSAMPLAVKLLPGLQVDGTVPQGSTVPQGIPSVHSLVREVYPPYGIYADLGQPN